MTLNFLMLPPSFVSFTESLPLEHDIECINVWTLLLNYHLHIVLV